MMFGGVTHIFIKFLSFFHITTIGVCVNLGVGGVGFKVDFKKAITHHPVYSTSNFLPLCSSFSLLTEHSATKVLSKVL